MKKIALILLITALSLFGVKKEEPHQRPDFTCKTGKLMITNNITDLVSIFVNSGTENSSYRQLKANETTKFETNADTPRIILELKWFTNKRIVVLKGAALREDPLTPLTVSYLYSKK